MAPVVDSWGNLPMVAGGLALIALGGIGVFKTFARGRGAMLQAVPPSAARSRKFLLFAGLTAVNPATLVYFVALTGGLGGALGSFSASLAFVLGVAVASLSWQLGLVLIGHAFRGRTTDRAQLRLNVAGHSLVLALGLAAIVASATT
ncbi:hypothetical protein ACX80E_06425 [Arthrobacter sp. TMN-49]